MKYGVLRKEGDEELRQSVAILNLTAKRFEIKTGPPKENIVQNHLNVALLDVF